MKTWTSVLALLAASGLFAASAFAQAPAPKDKADDKTDSSAQSPSTNDKSTMPPGSASDADKSSRGKDTMKSGRSTGERMGGGGNREQVRAVQQALKDKGHDPGSVDGVLGPKTQAALKDFQKAQGLKETGRLDAETMAKLGVESPAASPASGDTSKPDAKQGDTQKNTDGKQAK